MIIGMQEWLEKELNKNWVSLIMRREYESLDYFMAIRAVLAVDTIEDRIMSPLECINTGLIKPFGEGGYEVFEIPGNI